MKEKVVINPLLALLDNEYGYNLLSKNAYVILKELINKEYKEQAELYKDVYEAVQGSFKEDTDFIEYLEKCEITINNHKMDLTEIQDYEENTIDFLCLEIYCSHTFKKLLKKNGFDNNE